MAATRFTTQLLINGHSVAGEGRVEPILNPSTGELLCEVREASADQLRLAVDAASAACPAWAALTPYTTDRKSVAGLTRGGGDSSITFWRRRPTTRASAR